MAKPAIFSVDDDPNVLQAIEQDLRRQYGSRYRILRADSGTVALESLKQLALRNEALALMLVDQRMPQITGVELLEEAKKLFPDTKRVLLTAYADTDVAIRAINAVGLDYYLLKPWNPPEENLYPVLNDLLEDWQAHYHPPFEGIRIIGYRWSPRSFQLKDFMTRNQLPYEWLDVETSAEAQRLLSSLNAEETAFPLVILPDGARFSDPSPNEVAEKMGLKMRPEMPFYDLVIIGGGPAGLAAAVYGASEGLRTVVVEREAPGGQAGTSSRIENYLGFPSGLSGGDLTRRAVTQARRLGAEILSPLEAQKLRIEGQYRLVTLADGSEIACHAVLIAAGVAYHKLEIDGIDALTGSGVYYGAGLSEASACRNQDILIVGAGNAAGQAAVYFSRFARNVRMLVRGDSLTKSMSRYLIEQIAQIPNILVCTHAEVAAVEGKNHLEAVTIRHTDSDTLERLEASSLFILIGAKPRTAWLADVVARSDDGFILTGQDVLNNNQVPFRWKLGRLPSLLESSIPGVFAAGDVRHRSVKRVASAVGEGAIAVQFVHQYLASL